MRLKAPPPKKTKKDAALTERARKVIKEEAFQAPEPARVRAATQHEMLLLSQEKSLLERTIIEEKRALSKVSFWYFLTNVLFPAVWRSHYTEQLHKLICDTLQNLGLGEDFWAFLPREHKKSFIITIAHSIWLIVHDPNIRILLIGAREGTVKPFGMLLRDAFVAGTPGFEEFQRIYSDHIFQPGEGGRQLKQAFQFTVKTRTAALPDPTFRAAYLGVTGAGWRCDVMKFDDAVERRNVTHPEMSYKTLGQMMDLYPLLHTGSKYRNHHGAGTRWAYHDPYSKIIGEEDEFGDLSSEHASALDRIQESKLKVMVRHALEDPARLCEHCPKHVVAAHPHGHPTMGPGGLAIGAPIITRDILMERFEQYLRDPSKGEAAFWHQYMNVCMSPSAQKFKDDWFHILLRPSWPAPKRRVLVVDSASKDFQAIGVGDWMVALFGEFDDDGRLLLVHGLRSNRWTKDEFIRKIITYCDTTGWWPNVVAKEKFGEDTFLTDIHSAFLQQSRPVRCQTTNRINQLQKIDWIIEALQGPFEQSLILFGSNFPKDIIARGKFELTRIGSVKNDDVADAIAQFMHPKVRIAPARPNAGEFDMWDAPGMDSYITPMDRLANNRMQEVVEGSGTVIDSLTATVEDPFLAQAQKAKPVQIALADLGGEVNWDATAGPERLHFEWSENE